MWARGERGQFFVLTGRQSIRVLRAGSNLCVVAFIVAARVG